MTKKSLFWFLSFFFLIALNLFITFRYIHKVNSVNAAMKVLDEIGSSYAQNQFAVSNTPLRAQSYEAQVGVTDGRVANLKNFFRKYNSPLYDYAEAIVRISDKYSFDYRLLPAIAMQESTLCQAIPVDSHNCWGWGIYGNTITHFSSYEEAIETVAQGIRDNYLNEGRLTASEIMKKYTPSSNGSWSRVVNSVMRYLE